MNKMMKPLKRTRFTRRAAALIIAAVAMLLIIGVTALAVDGSLLLMTRNSCQVTADAAALAAVSYLPDTSNAKSIAVDYAEKNLPTTANGTVLLNSDAVPGHWISASRTFVPNGSPVDSMKVTVRRSQSNNNPMSLMFAKSFGAGFDSADVVASAVATTTSKKGLDVMIVQDVTGSFSTDIVFARKADIELLDCIKAKTDGSSLIGLTTFTGCGKLNQIMLPVTSSYSTLRNSLLTINTCGMSGMPACSGTNIGRGLETAKNHLMGTALSANSRGQAIVLVTDGMPNAEAGGCGPGNTDAALANYATQQAIGCASAGISIFCIFYNDDNVAGSATYLASLVRGEGIFLQTPDPTQLPDLLLQICDALGGPPKLVD
jgi:Mg-chelatase subunit ChlD